MDGLLKNLALDRWYKVCIGFGALLIVVAQVVDTKWLTNKQTGLAGAGLFFIGLGAWKNVKHKVEFTPPSRHIPAGIATYSVTEADPVGVCFWLTGLLSFGWLAKDLFV